MLAQQDINMRRHAAFMEHTVLLLDPSLICAGGPSVRLSLLMFGTCLGFVVVTRLRLVLGSLIHLRLRLLLHTVDTGGFLESKA
jgi:hypothetical protein